jgi:hypothetical protein
MRTQYRLFGLALVAMLGLSGREASAQFQTVYQKIDDIVNELKQGNKSLADMTASLGRLQANLDNGYYKDQVGELIRQAGGVAQLSGQALIDFTRERLIDDLERLKRRAKGAPEPERVPNLANFESPKIDFKNPARSTLTFVGWNLDVARAHPERYKVQITNDAEGVRGVDPKYLTLQGQYALTIDVSPNGIPLKYHDRKLSFMGYRAPFELAIVNCQPPPVEKIVSISGSLNTTNQDREGGFAIPELRDGMKTIWSHRFPEYPTWGDWHNQPFSFDGLSIDLPKDPRFLVTLTQEGARERNILWRFNSWLEFRTNLGNTIRFDQNGLSLRCGDGGPATVQTFVNRIR